MTRRNDTFFCILWAAICVGMLAYCVLTDADARIVALWAALATVAILSVVVIR